MNDDELKWQTRDEMDVPMNRNLEIGRIKIMTAKEFFVRNSNLIFQDEEKFLEIVNAMKEYGKQKCAEQRKLCAGMFDLSVDDELLYHDVLAAPEPNFD